MLDRLRGRGMVPGQWLEPEVIGVHSPMAERPGWLTLRARGGRCLSTEVAGGFTGRVIPARSPCRTAGCGRGWRLAATCPRIGPPQTTD
ncbi:hypothetical protein K4749_13590 [Streptomyces sp. TRM72054]|uniref:hypothetical protein n=1 Tax=Streptomyces sp. TRM72054 TaxID=2870562 RepID=UPI001C8B3E9A|nr:hypothetical protein [Streptomyces sp. TRM72054]MBX9394602.1 hypothetical protein [Streptomyces sp. TRM72054]